MIYRILIDEACEEWDEEEKVYYFEKGALRGAASGLSDLMWALKLPFHRISNPRARFYFTESRRYSAPADLFALLSFIHWSVGTLRDQYVETIEFFCASTSAANGSS